ncbi:MAG: Rrf2 family transcriptional regulator [Chloroflexota bacterium]
MKLSLRSDYGARAMIELGRRFGSGPVQSAEIAAAESIPEAYLEQLLTALRKAGLVRSSRGPRGGHELAKSPAQITFAEVVDALEGPFLSLDALGAPSGNPRSTSAITREIWQEIADIAHARLADVTIGQLVDRHRARQRRDMYHI